MTTRRGIVEEGTGRVIAPAGTHPSVVNRIIRHKSSGGGRRSHKKGMSQREINEISSHLMTTRRGIVDVRTGEIIAPAGTHPSKAAKLAKSKFTKTKQLLEQKRKEAELRAKQLKEKQERENKLKQEQLRKRLIKAKQISAKISRPKIDKVLLNLLSKNFSKGSMQVNQLKNKALINSYNKIIQTSKKATALEKRVAKKISNKIKDIIMGKEKTSKGIIFLTEKEMAEMSPASMQHIAMKPQELSPEEKKLIEQANNITKSAMEILGIKKYGGGYIVKIDKFRDREDLINTIIDPKKTEKLRKDLRKIREVRKKQGKSVKLIDRVLVQLTWGQTITEGIKGLISSTIAIVKNPRNILKIPKSTIEGFKHEKQIIAQLMKVSPKEAVARIGADIFLFELTDRLFFKPVGKLTGSAAARLRPSFRGIKTTALGVKVIKGAKKVGDIVLIPERSAVREIRPIKAIKEAKISEQLRNKPVLPKVNKVHKDILDIVKKRGDVVTGSFAQEALLKKQFSRGFNDLDILTKDKAGLIKELKKKFGNKISFKNKKVSTAVYYKGKQIADLVHIKVGEGGLTKFFPVKKVGGIKLVRPTVRLLSKLKQLKKVPVGKEIKGKVIKDIELLSGGKLKADMTSPAFKGAYGFTKKEMESYIGKSGPLTSSQIDLFKIVKEQLKASNNYNPKDLIKTQFELLKKGIIKKNELPLTRWFYASPFGKGGIAQTRISRLGLTTREGSLIDLVKGRARLTGGKPEIYVFVKEKIFRKPTKLTKEKTISTKGFVVPNFSSELEVVLGKNWILKKGKKLATIRLRGKTIPIYEIKKIPIPPELKSGIKEINQLKIKLLSKDMPKSTKLKLAKKIKLKEKKLNLKIAKKTGFSYSKTIRESTKVYPLGRKLAGLTSTGLTKSKLILGKRGKTKRTIKKVVRRKSAKRIISKKRTPSKSPTRKTTSKSLTRRTPSKSPTRKTTSKASRATSLKIARRTPLKSTAIRLPKNFKKVKLRKKVPVYYVVVKKGGKLVKLNAKPLTLKDAKDYLAYTLDNKLVKTAFYVPVGSASVVAGLPSQIKGYFSKSAKKLRPYKIKHGKKRSLLRGYIEKRRYGLDTIGEKTQIRKKRKPLTAKQKKMIIERLKKARAAKLKKVKTIKRKKAKIIKSKKLKKVKKKKKK